ncbi:MAG: hypothetical protein FWD57_07965, partial [Polyangiaceae bacterium]|nr:hypothetical protein [Polyangiaceae bacterium]
MASVRCRQSAQTMCAAWLCRGMARAYRSTAAGLKTENLAVSSVGDMLAADASSNGQKFGQPPWVFNDI